MHLLFPYANDIFTVTLIWSVLGKYYPPHIERNPYCSLVVFWTIFYPYFVSNKRKRFNSII